MSWIEWVGFLTTLIYLYFSVHQNLWLWPMGILSSLFYIFVFKSVQLYADMILQVYYLVVSVWGWVFWKKNQYRNNQNKMPILKTTVKDYFYLGLSFFVLYVVLVIVLLKVPILLGIAPSAMPYWDAFTTAASFVATWMLVKKRIEQWLFWIVIDLVSMGMYIYKGLPLTVILFFIYTIMAIGGYFMWLKDLKKQLQPENVYS